MNDWRVLIGHRTGFSLLETLIVLSVLGIPAAIALPSSTPGIRPTPYRYLLRWYGNPVVNP